jgi:hypothetical protein
VSFVNMRDMTLTVGRDDVMVTINVIALPVGRWRRVHIVFRHKLLRSPPPVDDRARASLSVVVTVAVRVRVHSQDVGHG